MKIDKINYLMNIANMGTVILDKPIFEPESVEVVYINEDGSIDDRYGGKEYNMKMKGLSEEYVNYIYNEVINNKYKIISNEYSDILSIIKEEKGSIELLNKIVINEGFHYYINKLSLTKILINISTDGKNWYPYNEPLRKLPINVFNYIKSEIKNGKYL